MRIGEGKPQLASRTKTDRARHAFWKVSALVHLPLFLKYMLTFENAHKTRRKAQEPVDEGVAPVAIAPVANGAQERAGARFDVGGRHQAAEAAEDAKAGHLQPSESAQLAPRERGEGEGVGCVAGSGGGGEAAVCNGCARDASCLSRL